MDRNKEAFIAAILNDPSLSTGDRERVFKLISKEIDSDLRSVVREEMGQSMSALQESLASTQEGVESLRTLFSSMTNGLVGQTPAIEPTSEETFIHDPRAVRDFLKMFSTDSVLKFAVHDWDKGEFENWDYSVFVKAINNSLFSNKTYKKMFNYNPGLSYALKNYLQATEKSNIKFTWDGNGAVPIGLQYPRGVAEQWMNNNKNRELWEMPLSAFPEEYFPSGSFRGRSYSTMKDIRDHFKAVIEFRGYDFATLVRKSFNNSDIKPNIDENSLVSRQFYTHTVAVETAFKRIVENIRDRLDQSSTVKIFAVDGDEKDTFELHIQHIGSFADRDIRDDKLLTGVLSELALNKTVSLCSICDFSTESRYSDDCYRIEYSYPGLQRKMSDMSTARISKIEESAVVGFDYILKFYK